MLKDYEQHVKVTSGRSQQPYADNHMGVLQSITVLASVTPENRAISVYLKYIQPIVKVG